MNLSRVVTPISVWWPNATGELQNFILLTRASCDDPKLTRQHYSPFAESKGDKEVNALEKGLGEMVGGLMTIPDAYDSEIW
jgi:hypothetical protein